MNADVANQGLAPTPGHDVETVQAVGSDVDDRREAYLSAAAAASGAIQALGELRKKAAALAAKIDSSVDDGAMTIEEAGAAKKWIHILATESAVIARRHQDLKLRSEGGMVACVEMIKSLKARQAPQAPQAPPQRPKLVNMRQGPGPGIKAERKAEDAKQAAAVTERESGRRAAMEVAASADAPPVAEVLAPEAEKPKKKRKAKGSE